jgi:5-methylcytosine-specific restriction enzyme A
MAARIGNASAAFPGRSGAGVAKKSLYGRRWRRYRLAQLQAFPLCAFCLELGRLTPATVVDHKRRHAGHADPLFWDRANFQSLCKPCHDAVKQALDRTGRARGYDENGLPLYPLTATPAKAKG